MLIEFEPPATFDDRHNIPRQIATCSVVGRRKFRQLYNQLTYHLSQNPGASWEQVVETPATHSLICQLLALNGLDIEWLSPHQIQGLLISRHDAQACIYLPGYLVELNEIPRNTEGPEPLSPEIIDPQFLVSPPHLFSSVIAEFVDRNGIVRPIYALSFAAYQEFYERLAFIKDIASGEFTLTWQEMFESETAFRYSCCRCLELNGISPNWVTFHQLGQLLINRHEDGQSREGWLLTLNRLPAATEQNDGAASDASGTVESIIASLYLQGVSLPDAFSLMYSVPAHLLTLTLREYSAQIKRTAPKSTSAPLTPMPTPHPTHRISPEEAERLLNETGSDWVEVNMHV